MIAKIIKIAGSIAFLVAFVAPNDWRETLLIVAYMLVTSAWWFREIKELDNG